MEIITCYDICKMQETLKNLFQEPHCMSCGNSSDETFVVDKTRIISLPLCLIAYIADCRKCKFTFTGSDLNLSSFVSDTYPLLLLLYSVHAVIFHKQDKGYFYIKGRDVWRLEDSQDDIDWVRFQEIWASSNSATVFLKRTYIELKMVLCELDINEHPFTTSQSKIKWHKFQSLPASAPDTNINGIAIDKRMIHTIISSGNFTSSIIDAYMALICFSQKSVGAVPCEWVISNVLQGKDLEPRMFFTRDVYPSSNTWSKRYIIFPECKFGHWIACVMDTKDCIIYMCDSLDGRHEGICKQVVRYVSFVWRAHMNKVVNYEKWKVCYFAKQKDFAMQSDNSSCGPYMLTMIKSIILGVKFHFDANYAKATIAQELTWKFVCQ